jgi:hypothetical protein
LADIAHLLGRKALAEVAVAAKPDTILRWFRKLVARTFDGSACRQSVGRPRIEKTIEDLIVQMSQENPSWCYDRMVGALANLGHSVSDQTVGNVLKRHSIAPAPQRKHTTRWRDFIRAHMEVLARTDFFTMEVFTLIGLVTYYVLFFIQLETPRVCLAGITPYPDQQLDGAAGAKRNDEGLGLPGTQSLPVARSRRQVLSGVSRGDASRQGQAPLKLPARSPNLNAFAERWVRSVKEECLLRLIFFGEHSLRRALTEYIDHFHGERNQGKGNKLLFPATRAPVQRCHRGTAQCKERLGCLLRYYEARAA